MATLADKFIRAALDSKLNKADELGLLKAEIAALQKVEKRLKAEVVEAGEPIEGGLFTATRLTGRRLQQS